MSDTSALISLKQAVSSFFVRSPLDAKFMEKMMVIAVECLSELNIYHSQQIREAYLDISPVNIANLPPDFIECATIPPSVIIGNRIHPLSLDNNIPLDTAIDCGNETNPQPVGITAGSHYPYYRDIDYAGQYGSHPTKNIGFYRIDKSARIIRLRGNITSDKLYLEYLSTGVSLDGETLIPRELMPVIRDYLLWQSIEHDPSHAANDKERKEQAYNNSMLKYHHWKSSFSIQEFLDTTRRNYSQSVKA